jgi:elongator complex protein 3
MLYALSFKLASMLNYIVQHIVSTKPTSRNQIFDIKRDAALEYKKSSFPKNSDILKYYRENYSKRTEKLDKYFEQLLRAAPIRSLSGIVAVTVLTKPYECPGNCLFCPNQKGMPKSYLKNEPAAARAHALKFDPYLQVKKRIESLEGQGHNADKIELIILGGTWTYYPKQYQTWFIKRCFDAANGIVSKTLKNSHKKGEAAKYRIIGLTIETRPDYINRKEVIRLRKLGVTRVELGVESIDPKILNFNNRGHGLEAIVEATKLLRDAGLKINYHIMLDLPGSSEEKDEAMLETLFSDDRFQPDWIKLYPTSVLETAPLYKLWKDGKYKPYSKQQLKELIIRIKTKIPEYVRITRLIRDIPLPDIIAGSEISNLRQVIHVEMKERGLVCRCIRCREIKGGIYDKEIVLVRRKYNATGGKEIFLSFEDKKKKHLYALLRLRLPSSDKHYIKEISGATLVRELHTHGDVVALDSKTISASQHKGLGRKLIKEAEKVSKEKGYKKIAVISGIGVREYYKNLGYVLIGTYMVKDI